MSAEHIPRLLPALPASDADDFVEYPAEIDRFLVRIWPDGTIYFKGKRARIEEFLQHCREKGIVLTIKHISLCG
ncbi:MAG TPA: hypothetical protein VGF67_19355 [Ktedonobacteraceae bacterium]|jgi:hypothetical protein